MGNCNFAGFEYRGLNNLGDNIQSIATERLLPEKVVRRFDRDTLSYAHPSEPMKIVMNGWFSHRPQTCLPLDPNLEPVFWGFHITDYNDSWASIFVRFTGLYFIGNCREYTILPVKNT